MYLKMARRVLLETDKRLLARFLWIMGYKGIRSVQKHKQRLKRGEFFPPFLYISIINSCNLRCQGCWVDVAAKQETIDAQAMDRLIADAKAAGNAFFGILGGEPFMHPELLDILAAHRDCYFQVFTNGHFITDDVARELRRIGNVTPLISIEGTELVSDVRRGRSGVYDRSMEGVENCLRHKILTGVCTSLCQSNFDDLLCEEWLDRLIEMGVFYTWFHIYRVVGPEPNGELALTPAQQAKARQFVVEMRAKKPIAIIDAYYDADGKALCPAATGFTHHVSPYGDIEPCPVIQFATDSIYDDRSLQDTFSNSQFLREFRELSAASTRGCVVLERPDLLLDLAEKHGARDTTVRGEAVAELEALQSRSSQYNPDLEIPEKSWAYRFVKRHWFGDFGTYEQFFDATRWQRPPEQTAPAATGPSLVDINPASIEAAKQSPAE